MLDGVVIRPARYHDHKQIAAINAKTLEKHKKQFPKNFETETEQSFDSEFFASFPRFFRRFRNSKSFLVSETAGVVVGYIRFGTYWRGKGRSAALFMVSIDDIGVAHDFRQKGIGSRLIDALLEFLGAEPDVPILATVWKGNTASEALFESKGFVSESKTYRLHTPESDIGSGAKHLRRPLSQDFWVFALLLAVFIGFGVLAWWAR